VSDDARRVVEALAGKLPAVVGGGPITVLTDGLRWASLDVTLSPQPAIALRIRSKDADAARAFAGLIRLGLLAARQSQDGDGPQIGALMSRIFSPKVDADGVLISIDSAMMDELAQSAAGPLMAARQRASLQVSMSNMRQLLIACIMYSNEHKDQFPVSLEEAAKAASIPPAMLVNPRDPARQPAFVYLKPASANEIKNAAHYVLIYEAHDAGARGIVVGFADGHIQRVSDEGTFQKILSESGNAPVNK
jgi:hypothetical protein